MGLHRHRPTMGPRTDVTISPAGAPAVMNCRPSLLRTRPLAASAAIDPRAQQFERSPPDRGEHAAWRHPDGLADAQSSAPRIAPCRQLLAKPTPHTVIAASERTTRSGEAMDRDDKHCYSQIGGGGG